MLPYGIIGLILVLVAEGFFILISLNSDDDFTTLSAKTKARQWGKIYCFAVGAQIVISLTLVAIGYLLSAIVNLM